MHRLAILSLHTSPLAQPGAGDGGGMNVYVCSLSSALARAGLDCDVYTRAWRPGLAPVVAVEPGFRVHHVPAGPAGGVVKEDLPDLVDEFTDGVLARMLDRGEPDLIHANYWLSGVAGHTLKHELGLPLVCTFHTLARVKAEAAGEEADPRGQAEAEVIGCSDTILASSEHERAQLARLYDADPGRVEVVPPGVDHERFSPGDREAARAALGLGDGPVLLFVGRIQPLKGADVAIEAAARCRPDATLLVVGGPSGAGGEAERRRLRSLVAELGVGHRVRFVPPQPHHRLATFYRAADVCLVPSRSESFGLVALEAAACGTPVVAAAVGGLQTLVEHGRTGFLVAGRDTAAFTSCVADLLGDRARAAAMGDTATAGARRYSWSITAARVRRLCADLTARAPVECQ
ncbi:MAG TPA: glycosyltransferase [Acidimicrobiales bacterium]|nr:glycosyltransferase [Acidimicrobiales bacterium]